MFLFAKWMAMNYNSSEMNSSYGDWWKTQLKHFNKHVFPNYIENGTVKNTKKYLKKK